jgi:hypothetical protein
MDNYGLEYIHANGLRTYGRVVMTKDEAEDMAAEVMLTIKKYCSESDNPIIEVKPTPLAI